MVLLSAWRRIISAAVVAAIFLWAAPGEVRAVDWDLVLLFTADIQGQIDPFEMEVKVDGEVTTQTVGGAARLAWALGEARNAFSGKTLTLSAGDDLIGPYAFYLGSVPVHEIMTRLGYDVGALGNHEFDRGDQFLADVLATRPFSIVASNLGFSPESPLYRATVRFEIFEVNGVKVGVFGLLKDDLAIVSNPGEHVAVLSDYAAVAREVVRELEAESVDVIVALAHIGLGSGRDLARAVPEIDVICVGDDVTLVERGHEQVEHADGSSTIVIQSGYRGEYLGVVKLEIDGQDVTNYHWQPLRMDDAIPQDAELGAVIEEYRAEAAISGVVAETEVAIDLRKTEIRTGESGFGSLVADIIRERFHVDICLLNSGMFRGDRVLEAGSLEVADMEMIFPFGDNVHVLEISGGDLHRALERSASALPEPKGWFLQVSGLRVEYDISQEPQELVMDDEGRVVDVASMGARVLNVEVLGPDGEYLPLDPDAVYTMATNEFISGGGDGYIMIGGLEARIDTGSELKLVVAEALQAMGVIAPGADGRIAFGSQ
ncbi:MAG: hypothetical protein D6E12_16695 [Desulfovibrio sp.]|nr:MAG: hypothetical protein D6E12_16695 [Desulfovibrio sp.]